MRGRGDVFTGGRAALALFASLCALTLLLAAGAEPASAGTGLLGAPQCDDNFDNDLDLKVDHDGAGSVLGPLPPDPHCSGPTDDSEQATTACSICANFVTTWDPDGAGGVAPRTRMHNNLIANVPYAIDLDTNRAPLPLGLLPLVPGYELRVTVEGFSATSPTIKIEKLTGAPANLPVRIEVVVGDTTKTSFGYDTLATTAPQSFTAAINLGDRDGNPATSEARVDLGLAGVPSALTIVNEQFTGDPAATRADRHVRRLTFSGSAAAGTQVPTSASLDLSTSATGQNVALTRAQPTVLEFELDEPGRGTDASGRVDQLPASAAVALNTVDVNGDGEPDQAIGYEASSVVDRADIHLKSIAVTENPDGSESEVTTNTDASVLELPTEAGLTFADPANRTELTYSAAARAARAEVAVDNGSRQFAASLDNLPTQIEELVFRSLPGSSELDYLADEITDHAHVESHEGTDDFSADVDGLPAEVGINFESRANGPRLEYDGSTIVPRAEVHTAGTIEGDADAQPNPIPDHRREIEIVADGNDVPGQGLARHLEFDMNNDEGTVEYLASDRIPEIRVDVEDEQPLFERANELELLIGDLAPVVTAEFRSDFIEFDGHGSEVGLIELLANSTGDGERLPANADGLLLRDRTNSYVLFGRVRGLRSARYVEHGAHYTELDLDASAPAGTLARLDSVRDVSDPVWTNGDEAPEVRNGLEVTQLVLEDYPAGIGFDLDTGGNQMQVDWTAAEVAGPMSFGRVISYEGAPVPVVYEHDYASERFATSYPAHDFNPHLFATLNPMPTEFHVCQTPTGDACNETPSGDIFTDGLFEDFDPDTEANGGSVRFHSVPETNFTLDQQTPVPLDVAWYRLRDEVDEAGDDCDTPVLLGFACKYEDVKPGLETSDIDLDLNDLAIQAHLESTGWVGRNIVSGVFGKPGDQQGYVAMDSGWRGVESVTGDELCEALGEPDGCIIGSFFHGHRPPPAEMQTEGLLSKGGELCPASEDCEAAQDAFPFGFGGKLDPLSLNYGTNFGASTRVFEFDPDELIFAEHFAGHSYCGQGTDLRSSGTDFTEYVCKNEIPLPAP